MALSRGEFVYNTEGNKDSRFIDAKVILGKQQLLFKVRYKLKISYCKEIKLLI